VLGMEPRFPYAEQRTANALQQPVSLAAAESRFEKTALTSPPRNDTGGTAAAGALRNLEPVTLSPEPAINGPTPPLADYRLGETDTTAESTLQTGLGSSSYRRRY
jgi:hypothetical protein